MNRRIFGLLLAALSTSACTPTTPSVEALIAAPTPSQVRVQTIQPSESDEDIGALFELPPTPPLPPIVTPTPPPTPRAGPAAPAPLPHITLDASSAEAFAASLQRFEQQLTPRQLDFVRIALASRDGEIKARMAAAFQRKGVGSSLSEKEMFDLAYADLHGATAEDLIRTGMRATRQYSAARANAGRRSPQ